MYDSNGHGTLCALTVNSICPNIEIYPIKIFDESGRGSSASLLKVLKNLYYTDIRVINISASFDSSTYEKEILDICSKLKENGKMIVASNYNNEIKTSRLACMECVIGVDKLKNALYDYEIYCNIDEKIQIKGNNCECFYYISDGYELFGNNSRLSCVVAGYISKILLNNSALSFEEIQMELEKLSYNYKEKFLSMYNVGYVEHYIKYYDLLLKILNDKYLYDKKERIDIYELLEFGILNPLTIIDKHNVDAFVDEINKNFNTKIHLEGVFLHQVTRVNSLIELIIKNRMEDKYDKKCLC